MKNTTNHNESIQNSERKAEPKSELERLAKQQYVLKNVASLIGKKRQFHNLNGLNTKELNELLINAEKKLKESAVRDISMFSKLHNSLQIQKVAIAGPKKNANEVSSLSESSPNQSLHQKCQ